MPTWEEEKRAGQTAFVLAGNAFSDVHNSIGNAYQQLLLTGHLYPSVSSGSLTHQITEDQFRQPEQQEETLLPQSFSSQRGGTGARLRAGKIR